MTKTQELLELAERCEKATGPDRRLDAEIGAAVRAMPMNDPDAWISGWRHPFIAAAQFKGAIAAPNEAGEIVCHWEARDYTASLDAAMTLVPEGDDICLTMGEGPWVGHFARIWKLSAELAVEGKDACEWEVCSSAPHGLALAICAASLRARSQS